MRRYYRITKTLAKLATRAANGGGGRPSSAKPSATRFQKQLAASKTKKTKKQEEQEQQAKEQLQRQRNLQLTQQQLSLPPTVALGGVDHGPDTLRCVRTNEPLFARE